MLQLFAGVAICPLGTAVAHGLLNKYTVKNCLDPFKKSYGACGRTAQSYIRDPYDFLEEIRLEQALI